MWSHLVLTIVWEPELGVDGADTSPKPGVCVRLISLCLSLCIISLGRDAGTHRVEEQSEEELASLDAVVQLPRAAGVLPVENCVSEKPAGLSREHLKEEWASDENVPFNQLIYWNLAFILMEDGAQAGVIIQFLTTARKNPSQSGEAGVTSV